MIQGKNYARQSTFTGEDVADEYRNCNFSQADPVDGVGGKEGVPLGFEGETPTFVECNLMNAKPPEGSTLDHCNTALLEHGVEVSSETVTIDGEDIDVPQYADRIHGSINPATGEYVYREPPTDILIDEAY